MESANWNQGSDSCTTQRITTWSCVLWYFLVITYWSQSKVTPVVIWPWIHRAPGVWYLHNSFATLLANTLHLLSLMIKKRKAANAHIQEAGTRKCWILLLANILSVCNSDNSSIKELFNTFFKMYHLQQLYSTFKVNDNSFSLNYLQLYSF